MILVSLTLMCLSCVLLVATHWIEISEGARGVLFMVCVNADSDLLMMFYASVRVELSLVSFERVINLLRA